MPDHAPPLESVLAALYGSEINCGLESFWDGGFRVWIGDHLNGHFVEDRIPSDRADTMSMWFIQNATAIFPESRFARGHLAGLVRQT